MTPGLAAQFFRGLFSEGESYLYFPKKQMETGMKPSQFSPKWKSHSLPNQHTAVKQYIAMPETQLQQASAACPDGEGAQYLTSQNKSEQKSGSTYPRFGINWEKCSVV